MRKFPKEKLDPMTVDDEVPDDVFIDTPPVVAAPCTVPVSDSSSAAAPGSVHSASCVDSDQESCKFRFDIAPNVRFRTSGFRYKPKWSRKNTFRPR